MSKKFNTKKTLKQMGLIPTRKQRDQMFMAFWIIVGSAIVILSLYGMLKYPIPYHYYDVIGDPATPYRNIAFYECPCGNDPECWQWESEKLEEKYV